MPATNQYRAMLDGLARATNTDPNATDKFSLGDRARERQRQEYENEDADVANLPPDLRTQATAANSFNRARAGFDPQWAPFYEAMDESAERQGKRNGGVSAAPGLTTDESLGTLPASLRGLPGVEYAYDKMGLPVAATMQKQSAVRGLKAANKQ